MTLRLFQLLVAGLLLSGGALALGQQRELPQQVADDLMQAERAAQIGDPGPALATIARLGSAGLTLAQRSIAARRLQEVSTTLLDKKVPGAALDVARSLARASSDLPEGVAAITVTGVALRRLGDEAAALKAFVGLVGPAPPKTPAAVVRARTDARRSTLARVGDLLLARGPAAALAAYLDARTVGGVRAWWGRRGGDSEREAIAIAALCPGRYTTLGDHAQAVEAAILLTAPVEERAKDGRVVRCGLRGVDVLRSLARVWDHRKQPALGKAYRTIADNHKAPARPYHLPLPNPESLAGFRVWRSRLARARKALPALERAAKRSDPAALYRLSQVWEEGDVVPPDEARAESLRLRAVTLNHGPALFEEAARGPRRELRALCVQALAAGERRVLEVLSHDLPPGPLSPKARAAAAQLGERGEGRAWILLAQGASSELERRAFLLRAARLAEGRSYRPLAKLCRGAPGLPADPVAGRLWRRCQALSDLNLTDLRWSALATGGWDRARLEAASRRYPAAATELAWLEQLAPTPRPTRARLAGLRGLETWRGRSVHSSEIESTPLVHLVRKDATQAKAVQEALAKRTDPVARHLRGYLAAGARSAVAHHRAEARQARRPACACLLARLDEPAGIVALESEWVWATRAASAGDAWAEAYRGQLLEGGLFGDPDWGAARACYTRAAKRGSPTGHLLLVGLELFLEQIQGSRREEVDRHLRSAATLGHLPAWARLARRLEQHGDRKQAVAAWAKGVAAGDPTALVNAADALLNRTEPNWKGGLKLLRRAAGGGSMPIYLRLLVVLHQQPKLREPGDP